MTSTVPESSIEILGHAVGGITYRHYAHRAPLAFRAIMTLPQPSAFLALIEDTMASAQAAGGGLLTLDYVNRARVGPPDVRPTSARPKHRALDLPESVCQ